jgi:hypothetical protein
LPGFVYEIHHNYSTPYDTVVSYLSENAKKDEIVYSLPEYTQNVLHFYLGDSLIMGSRLKTGFSKLPVEKVIKAGYPPYIEDYYPDWIVAFSLSDDHAGYLNLFSRGQYVYVMQKEIGVYWQDRTRPELPMHSFIPFPVPPNPNAGILIFRRMNKTDAIAASQIQNNATQNMPVPAHDIYNKPQDAAIQQGQLPESGR